MKQLIEEQKHFNEKFSYIADALDFYTKAHYPTIKKSGTEHLKDITDWHKQSLKQFIDGLIEREEKDRKWHKEFECNAAFNGKGCFETFCEDQNCRNAPKEWNQSKDSTISHLKELKENITNQPPL